MLFESSEIVFSHHNYYNLYCFTDVMTYINLMIRIACSFTECIRAKFGDKVLERSWPKIRTMMNQKWLEKMKQYRRISCTDYT